MTYLSLFSGIGGKDLGLDHAGMQCVGQVEIDDFCNLILEAHWPNVPKWRDIQNFWKEDFDAYYRQTYSIEPPIPDLICGGFPCQDISNAGKGAGIDGKRSGLWKEMFRVVREFRPKWIVVENVANLRTKGADTVLSDLEGIGYTVWPVVVGAFAVGLPHERKRSWLVAYSVSAGFQERRDISGSTKPIQSMFAGGRLYDTWPSTQNEPQRQREKPRLVEFSLGRKLNGVSSKLVRLNNAHALAAYGNAAVPEIVESIGRVIFTKHLELREQKAS